MEEKDCLDSLAGELFSPESPPAENTCEWVLSVQQFNEWRGGLPPLLWMSGELGCGKTTLMSFLEARMRHQSDKKEFTNARKLTICGFYCEEKNKNRISAKAILQGLVRDIVSQRHGLLDHVHKEFQRSRPWSYDQLWRCFQAMLNDPRIRGACIIIIDALDECDEYGRSRLLEDLGAYLGRETTDGKIPINLIVLSRPSTIGKLEKAQRLFCFLQA